MYIGSCYEGDIEGRFVYYAFNEMLGALHVLCNETHHLSRLEWAKGIGEQLTPEFIEEIKKVGKLTDEWCILMDLSHFYPEVLDDHDILDTLIEIEKLSLLKWNRLFKLYDKKVTLDDKKEILYILRRFYLECFGEEVKWLQPFILHRIKKELVLCKEQGLFQYVNAIHDCIEVEEDMLIFHKQKEHHIAKATLKQIEITVTTFLAPHLMLGSYGEKISLTKLIPIEEKKKRSPEDLLKILKALGDDTRLQILREIKCKPQSTQDLAQKLKITEAGISKHLKLLFEAGIVSKERKGSYIFYSLQSEQIDFIPYKISEYFM